MRCCSTEWRCSFRINIPLRILLLRWSLLLLLVWMMLLNISCTTRSPLNHFKREVWCYDSLKDGRLISYSFPVFPLPVVAEASKFNTDVGNLSTLPDSRTEGNVKPKLHGKKEKQNTIEMTAEETETTSLTTLQAKTKSEPEASNIRATEISEKVDVVATNENPKPTEAKDPSIMDDVVFMDVASPSKFSLKPLQSSKQTTVEPRMLVYNSTSDGANGALSEGTFDSSESATIEKNSDNSSSSSSSAPEVLPNPRLSEAESTQASAQNFTIEGHSATLLSSNSTTGTLTSAPLESYNITSTMAPSSGLTQIVNTSSTTITTKKASKHTARTTKTPQHENDVNVSLVSPYFPFLNSIAAPDVDFHFPDATLGSEDIDYYLAAMTREDVLHMPFPYTLSFSLFAGLRLSRYTGSGVQLSPAERHTLRQSALWKSEEALHFSLPYINGEKWDGGVKPVTSPPRMRSHELFQRLSEGDNDAAELEKLQMFQDRYFLDHPEPTAFRNAFCERFVHLLSVPHRPPLVIEMHQIHVAKFTLHCLFFRSIVLKRTAQRRFVLLSTGSSAAASGSFLLDDEMGSLRHLVNLTYLVQHPLLVHWYGVNGNIRHPKFTAVPVGYRFYHRSGRSLLMTSYLSTENENPSTKKNEEVKNVGITNTILGELNLNEMFPSAPHRLKWGRKGVMWMEKALEVFAGTTVNPPVEWLPIESLPSRITTIYFVLMPLIDPSPASSLTEPVKLKQEKDGAPHPELADPHKYNAYRAPSLTESVLVFRSSGTATGNDATEAAQHIALVPLTVALAKQRMKHQPYGGIKRELLLITSESKTVNGHTRADLLSQYLKTQPNLTHETSIGRQRAYGKLSMFNLYVFSVPQKNEHGFDSELIWEALLFGAIPVLQSPRFFLNDTLRNGFAREQGYTNLTRSEVYSYTPSEVLEAAEEKIDLGGPHNGITGVSVEFLKDVFDGLPVVWVNHTSEITKENMEIWRSEIAEKVKRGEYQMEKLCAQYWIDHIYGHTNED